MTPLQFDPETTALVLIDLQHAIKARPLSPHSFDVVVTSARRLGHALRARGGTVVYVRVDIADMQPRTAIDAPSQMTGTPPPEASELVGESGYQDGDLLITKRTWGAFYGTALDQKLRWKGIRTIILGGVATNFGVESTARAACDRGYELIFPEDAMSSVSTEVHEFPLKYVFPRMGHVRSTAQVLEYLAQ